MSVTYSEISIKLDIGFWVPVEEQIKYVKGNYMRGKCRTLEVEPITETLFHLDSNAISKYPN